MSVSGKWDDTLMSRMIQDLEDGTITPERHVELMRRLRSDPAARDLYLEHMTLVALLRQTAETREKLGTLPVNQDMLRQAARKTARLAVAWGIAAILAVALGLAIFQAGDGFGNGHPRIVLESSDDALYHIERADEGPANRNELRFGDTVVLKRGLLRLSLPKKVEAIIEGPSELKLVSEKEIRVDGGISWYRVPEAGRGFSVRTPGARIIDLGTEFGVWFDEENSLQVHVARGKVRVEPVGNHRSFEISEENAFRINGVDGAGEVPLRKSLFRRTFSTSVPYVRWSFDSLGPRGFHAFGSFPEISDYAARLRHRRRTVTEEDQAAAVIPGVRGNALSLKGDGLFVESPFKGIAGSAPRTVLAWVRYRGDPGNRVGSRDPRDEPYPGYGATTPFGEQAYLLDYGGTALTSTGMGEPLAPDTTYSLSFHVAARPGVPNALYRAELVAFGAGQNGGVEVLAFTEGEAHRHDMSERAGLEFTPETDHPRLGRPVGIRFVHTGRLVRSDGGKRHSGRVLYDHVFLKASKPSGGERVILQESFETPRVAGFSRGSLPDTAWRAPEASSGQGVFNERMPFDPPLFAWGARAPGELWAGFVFEGTERGVSLTTGHTLHVPEQGGGLGDGWHHVAIVYGGEAEDPVRIYLDGNPIEARRLPKFAKTVHAPVDTAMDSPFHVGALPGGGENARTLDADIDELFIFRAALDQEEIRLLMEKNYPVFPKNRK